MDPYVEREIQKKVQKDVDAFVGAKRWGGIDGFDAEVARRVARLFLQHCYTDHVGTLSDLSGDDVKTVVLHDMPKVVTRDKGYAAGTPNLVRALLTFTHEHTPITDWKNVETALEQIEHEFPKVLEGKSSRVKVSVATPVVREEKKVGRNDPCTCGSGKKWKACCGKA